ncbi:MAG TPA: hemolysin family protein [Candidatus Polarisedimenticolia bacterium]|nr:hemolysin family protein [Candidatus Polarisedimenticolia bacterium]
MTLGPSVSLVLLALLASFYFLIAVFRSAFAELNAVTANRILASRGLGPREGESPADTPPVLRVTFDLLHHAVLILAGAVCFLHFEQSGWGRPFVSGTLVLLVALTALQIIARSLALSDPERAFSATLLVIGLFYLAVSPLVAPVAWTLRRMRQTGRDRRLAAGDEEATEEEIEAFIDAGQQEGILEADEGKLIRQVVEFHDSVVREVMTPRTEVVALPRTATIAQAREVFAKERHSRLPVYRDQIDNVEGIITLKDVVASWGKLPEDGPTDSLLRPAYFVPETKQVSDLLKEMQARRIQLAVVVDEYGGTAGVVTIEDVLEQLVGDIQEEHEREEIPVVKEPDGGYLVAGTASLDDLRGAVGVELEAEGFETVAGLIYNILGRIPAAGEAVEHNGLRLEVVKADTRKIEKVRVSHLQESST